MGAPLLMSSSMRGGRGSPHCGGNMSGGVSAVPRMQVPSPAWRSGLKDPELWQLRLNSIPGPGT